MTSSSDLTIPLAVWNGIPCHPITAIELDLGHDVVVTGGEHGLVVLWRAQPNEGVADGDASDDSTSSSSSSGEECVAGPKKESRDLSSWHVSPIAVMFGHATSITFVGIAYYDHQDVIVSVSVDGSICLWNMEGICLLEATNVVKRVATTTCTLLSNRRHLACTGQGTDIEVVDLWRNRVVAVLSGHHMDWVNSLYPCPHLGEAYEDRPPAMVSASKDGMLIFWSLDFAIPERPQCLPVSMFLTESTGLLDVSLSNDLKLCLIVCRHQWLVYSASKPRLLTSVKAPNGVTWVGGRFSSFNRVIVWSDDGESLTYVLPKAAAMGVTTAATFGPSSEPVADNRAYHVHHSPKTHSLGPSPALDSRKRGSRKAKKSSSFFRRRHRKHERALSPGAPGSRLGSLAGSPGPPKVQSAPSSPATPLAAYPSPSPSAQRQPTSPESAAKAVSRLLAGPDLHRSASGVLFRRPAARPSPSGHLAGSVDGTFEDDAVDVPTLAWRLVPTPVPSRSRPSAKTEKAVAETAPKGPTAGTVASSLDTVTLGGGGGGGSGGDGGGAQGAEPVVPETLMRPQHGSDAHETPAIRAEWSAVAAVPTLEEEWESTEDSEDVEEEDMGVAAVTSVVCHRRWLGMGHNDGSLSVWRVPRTVSWEEPEANRVLTPALRCALAPAWDAAEQQRPSASGAGSDSAGAVHRAVTSSVVVSSLLLLVRGHADGCLSLSHLPYDANPSVLHAHGARVNCLWLPDPDAPVTDSDVPVLLVSGGADHLIKVWDIRARECLHVFTQHTAPIMHVFGPPERKRCDVRWHACFFTVALDRSVGLFSLRDFDCKHLFTGHPDQVDSVRWRVDQDFLIVGCTDGCVSVWELGTGQLEKVMHNQEAVDIMETCADLIQADAGSLSRRAVTAGFETFSHQTDHWSSAEAPIQIVQLDVPRLLTELAHGMESFSLGAGSRQSKQMIEEYHRTVELTLKSPAYKLYSYLLPWDCGDSHERLLLQCEAELGARRPDPVVSFGVRGENGKFTFLVPSQSRGAGRWQHSGEMSAVQCLAAVTLTNAFLYLLECKNACSQLLSFFCTQLPECVPSFVEPSLATLAHYWQHPIEDVRQSARSLFNAAVERLPEAERRQFADEFAAQLMSPGSSTVSKSHATLVLGIIGSQGDGALRPDITGRVVDGLIHLLCQPGNAAHRLAAAELLGKGFRFWHHHATDCTGRLLHQLFSMAIDGDRDAGPRAATQGVGIGGGGGGNGGGGVAAGAAVSITARASIMSMAVVQPKPFLTCIMDIIHSPDHDCHYRSEALTFISELIRRDAAVLLLNLSQLVACVMKALDPSVPAIRDGCLRASTSVLQAMVKKYPMVSFHQTAQHLAIGGTASCDICMYDLKSATQWTLLSGHRGTVSATAFAPDGKSLASYSLAEGSVKIWTLTTTFFGLGASPHCVRTIPVSSRRTAAELTSRDVLEQIRLIWKEPKSLTLMRGWEGVVELKP